MKKMYDVDLFSWTDLSISYQFLAFQVFGTVRERFRHVLRCIISATTFQAIKHNGSRKCCFFAVATISMIIENVPVAYTRQQSYPLSYTLVTSCLRPFVHLNRLRYDYADK